MARFQVLRYPRQLEVDFVFTCLSAVSPEPLMARVVPLPLSFILA